MAKALITLVYRQRLNTSLQDEFAKNVLHYSYEEFKLKSQVYNFNGLINTFTAMKANDGRANSLHYKTGFAVSGLLETLQKKIPVLKDASNRELLFD